MSNLTHLRYLLEEALSQYCFSGYQLYCESRLGTIDLYGGKTSYWPTARAIEPMTYFDVGSLTKVIFTTTVLARWIDQKIATLNDPVSKFDKTLAHSWFSQFRLGSLLAHSSGLIGWYPMFEERPQSFASWMLGKERSLLVAPPDTQCCYSDLGFLVLGLVLRGMGKDLEGVFEQEVRKPLGLDCAWKVAADNCAATEYCLSKGRPLQGEVFDENCAALGGVTSHAGLFASARGIAGLAREWLLARQGKSKYLSARTANLFTTRSNIVFGSSWAYGWDTKSPTGSSAGDYFSPHSFGHLGYPGCSLWIDPSLDAFAILLTNRIHPSRADERIRKLRPVIHDEIAQIWRANG